MSLWAYSLEYLNVSVASQKVAYLKSNSISTPHTFRAILVFSALLNGTNIQLTNLFLCNYLIPLQFDLQAAVIF